MVFEAVVADLLNRFIGDYVENLDKSQLKLGIWGGNVVLDNLKIKENALSQLGVPFRVKAGQIDKLTLRIPWKNLYNEAVVAALDGLYLLIVPGASIKYDAEKEEKQAQEIKQKELLRIEEALQKAAEKGKPKEEKKDTFLEKLATQVVKNLQVAIKHIHIRYEDDITDRNRPISMGVTLGELSLLTTDENWKACILNEAAKIIYKLVRLDCFCAYWNVNSSLYYTNSREQILLKLKQEIAKSSQEPKDYQYIFRPVSASAKLEIDPYAEIALVSPKFTLSVEVCRIAFDMTKPQYLSMIDLLESVDYMVRNAPYRKYRPCVPPHTHAKEWWKYAILSILEVHIRRHNRMWSWDNMMNHRRDLKAYRNSYKTKLRSSKITDDLHKELKALEISLDVFNITLARQQAQAEVIRSGQKLLGKKASPAEKQGGGWFSGFWGKKDIKLKEDQEESSVPEAFENLMTPDEKKKLYTAIGYSESSCNLNLPKQYVASILTFKLQSTSIAIREEHGVPEILKIQMTDLSTKVSQRPGAQALKVEAKLEHWCVTGLQQNGTVPSLVASVGDASSSLLSILFETNPEGGAVDQVLSVLSQPVEIVYDAKTVNGITEFFRSTKGMDLEQLTSATLMKLEEIKERTAAGLTHLIETRKILDLSIDLKPSYLVIPQTGFYHTSSSLLIVDFGNLQLNSKNHDGKQLSTTSFSSLEELMDRAYETYDLELKRVQILFSNSGEDWKAARLQKASHQHVLQPVDIKLHVAKSIVEEDARMANLKVSGELPLLHVKISDQKIKGVLELVDSIPLPETSAASPKIQKRKVTVIPVVAAKSENLLERILDPQLLLMDEGTESEESSDVDEVSQITSDGAAHGDALEEQEPRTSANEMLTVLQLNFEIREVTLELFRQENQEKRVMVFTVTQLGTEATVRTYDVTAVSYLGKISLDYHEIKDAENKPLHLITSADNSGSHLLKVEYIKADKNGPKFISEFDKTEQMIKVSFSSLDLLLHTQALLSSIQFLTALIPAKNPSSSEKESHAKGSAWKTKGSRLKKALKVSKDSEVFDFKLFAKLDSFVITVCDEKYSIADIRVQGLDSSVFLQSNQTEVFARLRDITVTDVDCKTVHKKVVSIVSDEVFSFRMLLYPGATEGDAYKDMSKVDGKVILRVGCIQIVYLHKFIQSLLIFLDKFQMAKEAVSTATVHAAEKAASSVKDFAQKSFRLAMDIHLKAPVFVVPESPVSQNALVADLGLITIQNTFMLAMAEDSLVPPVIDKMQLQLNHMRLYRTVLHSGQCQPDIQMLKPISLQLTVERNLAATWFYSVPGVAVKGDLQTVDVVLSQEDLDVLQKILTNNFGDVANKLQEEKQPKHCEEKKEAVQKVQKYATVLNVMPEMGSISEDKTTVQLYFEIKEVVVTLTKPVKQEHCPFLVLSIIDVGTETAIKSYDMLSKSHLKKISMTCFEFTDSRGDPLQIVSSSESNTDLLTIEYLKADRNGPHFKTVFSNAEQTLNVAFASLDLLLHMQALLALINFFTPALPSGSLSTDQKEIESKAKVGDEDRQAVTKAVAAVKDDVFSLKLVAQLGAFNVLVCDENCSIADIKVQGMNASVSVQSRQTEVFARLQNIVVMDCDTRVLHKKAVSIIGDEVFSFRMLLYPFATEGEAYSDMSKVDGEIMLRVGCIQIVYLHRFLMSLLMFLDNFQTAKEALGAATRQAAEKAASSMMDLAQKSFRLSMDIYLKAPVIVIPESSVSQNAIIADLGLITLKNQFSLVGTESGALPPVIDRMDMQLTHLKLSRTVVQMDNSYQPATEMLQPVNLLLSVHRNLAFSWYRKIPAIEICGDLKPMKIAVSQSDVTLLMKILLENLGEGARVKETEQTQEVQVSKLKAEKTEGAVDTSNDSIEVTSSNSMVEAESPCSDCETFKFAFHFESLSIVLLIDDSQQTFLQSSQFKRTALGELNLHLMTSSGKLFQDGTVDVNTKLKGCTLDDVREGLEMACTRMIDKKTAPDDHVIIDITYKQDTKESSLTAILEKLYVCASMEFLLTVADFFIKAMPHNPEANTNKSAQFKQVSTVKSASPSGDVQRQKMTLKALVIDPEIVFVANLKRADAPALAVSFQCDFFLSSGEESQMILAILRDLKMLACPFLREKRGSSVTTVLQPSSLTLESRISPEEQNITMRIPGLAIKISPIILNTVMTIMAAVAPKQVEAETQLLTNDTGNVWASKNIQDCDYWFLGIDKAKEVEQTCSGHGRKTVLEALSLEVDSVQVTMECGQGHRTVPVLLAELSLNVKAKEWTSLLSVDALMSLEVHYYNEMHAVWEPLVERLDEGTRRWNLKLELQNNPAQDTVPGDDFLVFPEPKTSISISSKDTMNITITKCSLDVFNNLAKAFSEGTASSCDYCAKDRAPYTVKNALGVPLKLQLSSILQVRNLSATERVQVLDAGQVLELEYSALEPLHRGRLSALQRQESSLFGFTVAPHGYSEVANIPVVKPGRRLYSVSSLASSNQVSLVTQIDAAEGNKIITIRSSLQIKNHFNIPFIVCKLVLDLRLTESIGVVRPEEEFHVPLESYRCQLFLRPAGGLENHYKESTSHITWKEMVHRSTEIKSILHCPCTEDGSPPLIVSTIAVPDRVTFVANSGEEEWDPAYIIHIYPMLTLKNLLPYPLRYLVEGTAETHEIAEGSTADILYSRINGELMELTLVKYQGRNWNGHLKLHSGLPEFFLVCFTADSVEKLTVDLSVHVKWVSGRMVLSVFSPYWIINQTSRILQYRAEDIHVKHPADLRDIVLFSFKKKNIFSKSKIQLCISTSGWSSSFSLDAVGSYGCVKCPANNMEFLIGVKVKMSSFSLTKIITLTPFFTLANKSSYELEVSEVLPNGAVASGKWHYVPAAECLPFWPETTSGKLCIRVVGFEQPSKPFFYNRQDNGTLLTLDDSCGGIVGNVDIHQHCIVISFSDYCDGAAPAILINHTPEATICYGQSGIQETVKLHPGKVHLFAWIDPSGTRKLTWKCEQNSGELELLKDECGQFPFDQATQIHWVSFLDGRQRVLLFTEDVALVSKARQAEEMEQPNIGIDILFHKLGLSLVNNDNKQEVAYIGINSSNVIWEYRPKQRWKPFQEKNITILENAYKKHLNNAGDPGWIKLENNFEVYFDKIPMEMRKPFRFHIRRNFQSGIQIEFKQSAHQRYLRAQMYWLQIDNQLPGAMFPVVFHPVAPPKSIALDSEPKPFIDISIITRFNEHSQIMQFKYFMMLIQEMALKVDQGFLEAVIALFTPTSDPQTKERNKLIEQDMKALNAELMESSMKDISGVSFFELLHISPIKLHLSLSLGTGGDDADKEKQEMVAMQTVNLLLKSIGATLTDVDDLIFKLGFFQVEYQFYRQDDLMKIAVRHYTAQFLKQMYVLVLGLDVLGNPFGLIRGLTEGVEAFFYEPFQGAVQGPEEFAEGIVIGVRALLGHTVGGAAGVVSRITGTVGKGLAAMTMDKEFQQKRREEMNRQPKDFGDSLAKGGKGLLRGVVGGVTGIITKPVEGAKREGAAGFFKGIGKGLVGVVARPTGGIIDMASSTFQGIQRVAESTEEVAKLRPPRVIKEDGIIRPYCHKEAKGCELFEKSDITKLEGELYHAHCDVKGSKNTKLLITNRRVMCVKQLEILSHLNREWDYLLEDFTTSPSVEESLLKLYVLDKGLFQKKDSSRPEVVKNVQLADISAAKMMCNSIEDVRAARQTQKLLKKKSMRFISKPNTAV